MADRSARPTQNSWSIRGCFCLLLVVLLFGIGGCDQPEPIRQYAIPTDVPAELSPSKDRMLAVMIPREDATWFFKVLGPEPAVSLVDSQFREFVRQVEFGPEGPLLDNLPEGWRRGKDRPMRHASVDINTPSKQLDLSISRLGRQDDWDQEVLMNVNRWRGQVGLEPSQQKWAGGEPIEVAAADDQAVWVDLLGKNSGGSAPMTPPFANRSPAPPPMTPTGANRNIRQSPPSSSKVKFELPAGWRPGRSGGMRWEAFEVGPEDNSAEVTVIPAGGDLRGNVSRWLGQVRQGKVPDDVVDAAMEEAESLTVDGRTAQRFVLTADPPESGIAIDATVLPLDNGQSLFIKNTGPYEVVAAEADAMRSFLESLELNL